MSGSIVAGVCGVSGLEAVAQAEVSDVSINVNIREIVMLFFIKLNYCVDVW